MGKGTKIVPNNIYDLLTPVSLAHWIMGDGNARPHGLILCTDSYSIEDVIKLMNVLIIKYRVECTRPSEIEKINIEFTFEKNLCLL